MTTRIGDPMTYEAAHQWLTGGESPAGLCSGPRARQMLAGATDAGAVHLTAGRVLTWDGSVYEVFPSAGPSARDEQPGEDGAATIIITHRHRDGTLIEGSVKGDGVWEILLELRRNGQGNWRYFPSLRQFGLGQSRDKAAQQWKIDKAAEALRAAGFDVAVEVSEGESRSFAEIEAERYEKAEERADRRAGYAENATARSDAAYAGVRRIADGIPFGQPILVGHHSEGRARRDQQRMHDGMRKSIDEGKKADYHASRAAAAERYRDHRESVPVTLRRIEKLEAEARLIQRRLDGTDKFCDYGTPATGGYQERISRRAGDIAGELQYWREHVAKREAEGVKVWSRADFAKGDYVQYGGRWYEVERVNPKSLSVPHGNNDHLLPVVTRANVTHATGPSQWTGKVAYDEVRGRKSAAEMAAALAAAGSGSEPAPKLPHVCLVCHGSLDAGSCCVFVEGTSSPDDVLTCTAHPNPNFSAREYAKLLAALAAAEEEKAS